MAKIYSTIAVGILMSLGGGATCLANNMQLSCETISGDYNYIGRFTSGIEAGSSISFSEKLARPVVQGASYFRVRLASGAMIIQFFSSDNQIIGDALNLVVQCDNGKWRVESSVKGNPEGTPVSSVRQWRYYRDADVLIVEFESYSTIYYFPWWQQSRHVKNAAVFSVR